MNSWVIMFRSITLFGLGMVLGGVWLINDGINVVAEASLNHSRSIVRLTDEVQMWCSGYSPEEASMAAPSTASCTLPMTGGTCE